jgi:hypothetical protein
MKRAAALSLLLSLVFASSSFAILRPRYPIKPTAPDQGHWIIIGGDNAPQAPPRDAPVPPVN